MHADPHAGNLLKLPPRAPPYCAGPLRLVRRLRLRPRLLLMPRGAAGSGSDATALLPPVVPRLAYLDFGLVSEVPLQVREARVSSPNPNPNPYPNPTPNPNPNPNAAGTRGAGVCCGAARLRT